MAEDPSAAPLNEVDTNVPPRRANALQIREPSPPGQKPVEPSKPEAAQSPVEQQQQRRSCALEIREPEAPTPPCTPPDEAQLHHEDKDSQVTRDRTPSPPGSRLGRWMGGA